MDIFDKKTYNRYTSKRKGSHHSTNDKNETFDRLSDRLITKLCKHQRDARETTAIKNSMKYFVKKECDKVTDGLFEKSTIHENVSNIFKHLIIRKIHDSIDDDPSSHDPNFTKDITSFIDQHIASLFDLKDIIQLFALSIVGNNLPNIQDFLPLFSEKIESVISQRMSKYCEDKLIDKDLIDQQLIQVVMNNYLYLFDEFLTSKMSDPDFRETMTGLIDKSIVTNFGKE
jgi:hypothetical protein